MIPQRVSVTAYLFYVLNHALILVQTMGKRLLYRSNAMFGFSQPGIEHLKVVPHAGIEFKSHLYTCLVSALSV